MILVLNNVSEICLTRGNDYSALTFSQAGPKAKGKAGITGRIRHGLAGLRFRQQVPTRLIRPKIDKLVFLDRLTWVKQYAETSALDEQTQSRGRATVIHNSTRVSQTVYTLPVEYSTRKCIKATAIQLQESYHLHLQLEYTYNVLQQISCCSLLCYSSHPW